MTSKNEDSKNNEPTIVAKKRGRKSKKDIELAQQAQNKIQENINVIIEETDTNENSSPIDNIENLLDNEDYDDCEENEIKNDSNIISTDDTLNLDTKPVAKKRGRKPKGGKIIQQIVPINTNKETKPNVILHLKCSLKDLQVNSSNSSEILSYNFNNINQLAYDVIESQNSIQTLSTDIINISKCEENFDFDDDKCDNNNIITNNSNDIREVWKKLKQLEHNLHINNICDKKSACFWCTYEFDNPPVYIPKHYIKDSYHVYGCFCSPECATAYLMDENIDSSSKFERYHLINHIYSKIYDYKKNIKPAPNPYYMLEKYYGNLTIQEYRALLKNERLFLIVDKPLTRILPELHEDNDDFIINNKIIPSNTYQIKKKLQNKQTKNNILTERFGLSHQ
jgi:hypothetical protein